MEKITVFQKHVILKSQIFPIFGEIPNFSHFWRNPSFFKIPNFLTFGEIPNISHFGEIPNISHFGEIPNISHFGEIPNISHFGEIPVLSHFYRIPCIFQNFRVFKKFPVQSSFRIPYKNSVFFPKIPVQKTIDVTNSVFFPQKFRVLQNSPVFIFFKSLKTLEKTMYFCIKTYVYKLKTIYLQIKNIYKRQGFILRIIFTVF